MAVCFVNAYANSTCIYIYNMLQLYIKSVIVNFNEFLSFFQNYINFILAHPMLARHISVKRFLDPANYSCDFQGTC